MVNRQIWQDMEAEYISTEISLQELSLKFGVSKRAIEYRSRKCEWVKQKNDFYRKLNSCLPQVLEKATEEIKEKYKPQIESAFNEYLTKLHKLKERVKIERMRLAFFDIKNIYDENGELKAIAQLSDDESAAINSIKVHDKQSGRGEDLETWQEKEIRLADKDKHLTALEKMLGMYNADADPNSLPTIDHNFKIT